MTKVTSTTLRVCGKVNLTLQVVGRPPSGYHEIESVMQSIDLADTVVLQDRHVGIVIECSNPVVPCDQRNLAWQAAELMIAQRDRPRGVAIGLNKTIPVSAGLGGGSADAAAVLVGLNARWNIGLDAAALSDLGARLGADVPFFVRVLGEAAGAGTAVVRGIGEQVHAVKGVKPVWIVLANPGRPVSTAAVYQRLKPAAWSTGSRRTAAMVDALRAGEVVRVAQLLVNDLERCTFEICPETETLKWKLLDAGALGALVSGSGGTVFGIASTKDHAQAIGKSLTHLAHWVYVTRTMVTPADVETHLGEPTSR